jgi:hypothetical protein
MENSSVTRRLYRLLPFMFFFQLVATLSVLCLVMASGGLDLSTRSVDIPGLRETYILLPSAFVLTVISLLIFPKLKSEEPAMLLFFGELFLHGALVVQAFKILYLIFVGG